jgi:hypothetical protein
MALDRAIAELTKEERPSRRAIVIIGDGFDTNDMHLEAQQPQFQRELARYNIEVYAIVWTSALSPDGHRLTGLTSNIQIIQEPAGLPAALARVWRELKATAT